jgi:hypothetical protein
MIKRLFVVGLVLILTGGIGFVALRASQGKKCLFSCRNKNRSEVSTPKANECSYRPAAESEKKVDCNFESKDVFEVLNYLAQQGLNIVYVSPLANTGEKITVQLSQIPVTSAAVSVLRVAGWKFDLTPEKVLLVFGR